MDCFFIALKCRVCEIFRTFRFSRFLHVSFFKSSTFRFAGFIHPEIEVRIMEIQFGYQRFSLCHDDFAMQIALDIPLGSVFLHLRHKNLAEIIRNIQNITNFVDGDYDDGRLLTVDSKPLDVQRLCPTADSPVAHAPTASAWGGGAMGAGRAWQRAQRRETPALQVLQNVFSWQGG